jgi:hypothetical protein
MGRRQSEPEPIEVVKVRTEATTRRIEIASELFKKVVTGSVVVACVYIIMGVVRDLGKAEAGTLTALAQVVKALQLHVLIGYIVGAGGLTAWYVERQGKKRAVKALGDARHRLEAQDAYRASSGLDPYGDTPRSK